MIKKIIVALLIFSTLISSAMVSFAHNEEKLGNDSFIGETPGIQWSRQYGAKGPDHFNKVRKTADGGYLIVGDTKSYSPDGYYAAWLVKTDAFGYEEWNHTYSSYAVFGTECQQTSDGGYAFCGVNNESCYWLVKTDAYGEEQWEKSFDDGTAWCFQQTTEGGYIIAGFPQMFIRTDSQGNVLWKKTYFNSNNTFAYSIQQTEDGGFIVTGKTDYYSHGDHVNGFLLKLDQNGTKEWDKTFMETENSVLQSVQQIPDNGYIAVGAIGAVYYSPWVVRTDQDGTELWNRTYNSIAEIAHEVILTNDGGFALAGEDESGTSCIIKTISNGTKEWEFILVGYLTSLQQAADGSIIIAGVDESVDNLGNGILMKIGHVPSVEITKPTKAIYLFDQKIRDFFTVIALGRLTVEVNASDIKYNIDRVEFAVDGTLKNTDIIAPYNWQWTTLSFFSHTLTVTAYNAVGNCSKAQIRLFKIF
ncbi:MAG TPA: hypothetical protein DSN98_00755 [Thermoplasmata archaeon]|jgi:hypothetical protein|nr:MAG TPA: hypothetical protein DSN98_00755 [Thermoplasmata archaeon]